ncbi:oxygen-independent coproporphyrinogen III oxidase [Thalassotalea sp. PS06]|uniref:oxygen-independent coproporphyrinogen III oxidase n=1 Tax=Thalassotalea sp. PS06 TaxID=2594005 RepID=UPI0011648DD1|nr:oxygen-independent coproporphyrinogen III oxidase [Thalassotalea sp. PS06]QDO99912.1 oxygen-independent coproporphyrinogen III oxidase [Thalassotalea sp. PS06]
MSAVSPIQQSLVSKYNLQGPRYTSYPTALEFTDAFDRNDFLGAIEHSDSKDLSLYIHIPFCHKLCYYCGCNKIVTRQKQKAQLYLSFLKREITTQAKLFPRHSVCQVHLGGGTPTFLNDEQLTELTAYLKEQFQFAQEVEMGIEIDPREMTTERIEHLRRIGFNRLSIGVQDVNETVQEAINRQQSTEHLKALVSKAKEVGFSSINLDLIYGLPHQSTQTMEQTIAAVFEMDPDRISLFSYAHLPQRFAAQRKIKDQWLPSASEKMQLMEQAITAFVGAGYQAIGMDHFAKPDDELAIAQRAGRLHRNFQGYTTYDSCDLLGLGVSSISAVGNSLAQNHKQLTDYYQSIEANEHALARGVSLSTEDVLRSDIIRQLMCNFRLDKKRIESQYRIDFDAYFEDDLQSLTPLKTDGLLIEDGEQIQVSDAGRLFVRNICMSFDQYIKPQLAKSRYSSIV